MKTSNRARFVEQKENLILYGAVGTGKTHLATAIGVEACNQGKVVKFYRTAALVNDLVEAKNEENLSRFMIHPPEQRRGTIAFSGHSRML